MQDGRSVSLHEIFDMDMTVGAHHKMPCRYYAERRFAAGDWTFAEQNGYLQKRDRL